MTPPSERLRDGDVLLSLPEMDDVEAVVRHSRHPDMQETYWLPGRPAVTTVEAEALIEELRRGWDGSGEHGAALFVRRGDEFVGAVYLWKEPHGVELGYGVAPSFGTGVWRLARLVDWLAPTGVPLSIRTDSTNRASCRIAEKFGFRAARVDRKVQSTGEEYLETVYERQRRMPRSMKAGSRPSHPDRPSLYACSRRLCASCQRGSWCS
jgi:RimJ/RimL family protein N-acetyltransferase